MDRPPILPWPRGRPPATLPALAADTGEGPFRDRLYAAWADHRSGENQILLSHSEDRGKSWSEPIVVNRGGGKSLRADVSLHSFNEIGGHTAGMAADASGRFHPVWVDNRTGVPQMWTAPVSVDGGAVRNGDPALSRLRNSSSDTIRGPMVLRVTDLSSEFGEAGSGAGYGLLKLDLVALGRVGTGERE